MTPPVNNSRQQEVQDQQQQQQLQFQYVLQQQPYPYHNPTLTARQAYFSSHQQQQLLRARREQWYMQRRQQLREANRRVTYDYSSFTSFLCRDNSFFSPWSWVPDDAPMNRDNLRLRGQERFVLQPGSFFSQEIPPTKHEVRTRKSSYQECKEGSK